jgi:glycine C-acetyltransferase
MFDSLKPQLETELKQIREAGLYKDERVLASPQGATVKLTDGREVLVFCANNYLGLSSHPDVIAAAHKALDSHGYGLSSVRFICGPRTCTRPWKRRSRPSSAPRTRCSTPRASMPTAACSSRCSASRTRSSRMP